MTAPSIQLALSMSAENIASSVHAFETSMGASASFAEQLDRAVQSIPRPEMQPSDMRSATPKQTADPTQARRAQAATARSNVPQPRQNAGNSNASGKAQNSDPSPVQKDERRQPAGVRSRDSRPSDNSRNSGRHQAGDEEDSANSKSPFAQAVAQSVASQSTSTASSTQPAETSAQPSDVSIPAALLALLQAAQSPAQAVAVPTSGNDPNAVQTDSSSDSSSTDVASMTPSNLFQLLNFGSSNAAYQAALTSFQTSTPAAQSTSGNGASSASQPSAAASSANSLSSADQQTSAPGSSASSASSSQTTSANTQSVPPSASLSQVASAVATDPTANTAGATESASRVNSAASAAHVVPSTNGQQADTNPAPAVKSSQVEAAEPANFIRNLKSDAGQHEAAKPVPVLDELATAAKAKSEPELQQAATSVTVTNHASLPAFSRQAIATDSQYITGGQDSGSPAVAAPQSSAGWTDDSSGDSDEDDASAQSSSASQGSNSSKSSGAAVEFVPSSAFNNDAVGGVAPEAVHAVAAGTLQSNTGLDNTSFKTPEAAAQNLNSAAQEKAFAAWQSVSAQIGRVVNTATLNALQNGTEMRVQLRTDAFGSMDIRATLEGGKIGAAIGVESAEAHNALLSQLPALQQSLNERQVQLDQISVVSSYGQSGTDFGTGSGKQNGDPTPSNGYRPQASGPEQVSEPVSAPVTEAWQPATSRGRLSVQA